MNLVQLQDELRLLPLPLLDAKAKGQDPQTPPWLATAVLNERMAAKQKAGLAQGAAQGKLPSVAEQLQQKAGLMALQAQQQQQAQQQMMQQMTQAPQPAPEGVPQPQQQPEPEQMMARGGIARLPVDARMFNYKEGGVIGFANAGEIPARLPGESQEEYRQRVIALQESQMQADKKARQDYLAQQGPNLSVNERLALALGLSKPPAAQPQAAPQAQAQDTGSVFTPGSQSGLRPAQGADGLASLQKPPPPAPRPAPRPAPAPTLQAPAPQAPAAPAPAAPSELEKMQMDALRAGVAKAPTIDELRAERRSATPEILNQPAGLAQLARLKQQQEEYDKSKEDRGLERLIAVMGARAKSGLGGYGTGYLNAVTSERAADAAQAKYQNDVMTAVEAAQRGEATKEQEALLAGLKEGRTAQAEATKNRLIELNKAQQAAMEAQGRREQNVSAAQIAAAHDVTSLKVAQIHAAATRAAAEGRLNTKEADQLRAAAIAELKSAQGEVDKYIGKPVFREEDKRAKVAAEKRRDAAAKALRVLAGGGGTMTPSPGAAPAAPALKYNPATGKIE